MNSPTSPFNTLEEGDAILLDYKKLAQAASTGEDLLPVVVQDAHTREVLIIGYANRKALEHSLSTGMATLWSTSRNELWIKGKTSGDYLKLLEVRVNCEQNSLLYLVEVLGSGACHTKDPKSGKSRAGCFYRKIEGDHLRFVE